MTDSSSFTSLMAMVDSHLSKTSMQTGEAEEGNNLPRFQLPSLTGGPSETLSETRFPFAAGEKLPLPTRGLPESPIQEVLARQMNNMLKAKENRQRKEAEVARLAKEREKLAEEMRQLKMQDDCVIDLVKAVKESMNFDTPPPVEPKAETLVKHNSFETLFDPKFNEEPERVKTPEPLLPCKTDMSYIMKEKVRQGRCSAFGKVLTSRLKPVSAPYLKDKSHVTKVVRFDFTTKSPCDLIKERLRQPRPYNRSYDIFSIFPDLEVDDSET